MKILDLTFKDMLRAFRSLFALVMMFVAPLLITGLIHMAFGGSGGEEESFNLTTTRLLLVNEDVGLDQSDFLAGDHVVAFLQDERLADILAVEEVSSWAEARIEVESGTAGVALHVPANFTQAITSADAQSKVTLYYDSTLSLGPAIARDVVQQFMDSFSANSVLARVTQHEFEAQDLTFSAEQQAALMAEFGTGLAALNEAGAGGTTVVDAGVQTTNKGSLEHVMASTMAGMLIFFLFFTGMSAAQSILTDEEEGTLARLFTTPTSSAVILGSKLLYAFLILLVQSIVLILVSQVLFNISWGSPATIIAAIMATILVASGFGLAIMSFVENSRQAGPIFGGVLTVSAMLGGLFTTGMTNIPSAWETLTLFTPHGWALKCWQTTLDGVMLSQDWQPFLITTLIGLALFIFGVLRFRRRFA